MYVKLSELAILRKGTSITRRTIKSGNVPVIAGGRGPAYFHNVHNREEDCITISASGAYAGHVLFHNMPIFASDCITVETASKKLNQKFLYYSLKSRQEDVYALQSGGAQPHVYVKDFLDWELYLPSVKEQIELVTLMDSYQCLTSELEAEIQERKHQYEYCRKILLSFENIESVRKFDLGQVCRIKTGDSINKMVILANPGRFPVINSGREPLGYIDKWNTDDDPIGIASRGSVGLVSWTEGKYYRGNLNYSCTIFDKSKLIDRYLYFALCEFQSEIHELCTFHGIPALNKGNLEKLKIPVPEIMVQNTIVEILNTFSKLQLDIQLELQARAIQQEYYLKQLLKF